MRVYIIGFMGAGKSRYAKILASEMGYSFLDLDLEIERSEKIWIAEIFKTKGEDYFRKLEQIALKNTIKHSNVVIACGGGAPVFFDNMEFMNKQGITIYIKPETQIIIDRLSKNPHKRPLISELSDEKIEEKLIRLLKERNPYYRRAHLVIDPNHIDPCQLKNVLLI